jgi:hypothetical protein
MKLLRIGSALGAAFLTVSAGAAAADTGTRDFVVAITDESNVDTQQASAKISLHALSSAKMDVRLADQTGASERFSANLTPDGGIASTDRFLECYSFARAALNAARRADFEPTSMGITAGLMQTAVPLSVDIRRTGEATLVIRAASRGMLSDGQVAVPAAVTLEGTIGYDGTEPTSATIRETAYSGYTTLPAHATTCRIAPPVQQA